MWEPSPRQADFLRRVEFEALFGGSKGGGKSDGLLYGALDGIDHPYYHAAIFRRSYPELQELMDRAGRDFHQLGATWNESKKRWRFPSGARYSFFFLDKDTDLRSHDGKEYHTLSFDQLEQFNENQYTSLIACCRTSVEGIQPRVRSSANPGGPGHHFVKKRFIDLGEDAPFMDPVTGLTRVFIPSKVWDNPHLMKNDPAYVQRLMGISDPAKRAAFLEGDWNSFSGQYFSEWTEKDHVCDAFELPQWWERGAGMDWGYSPHPGMVNWFAYDEHGMAIGYKELRFEEMTAEAVGHAIVDRSVGEKEMNMDIKGDYQMWTRNPETGVSIAETINDTLAARGTGILLVQANKDRINGWAAMHQYLDPKRPAPTGDPRAWLRFMRVDTKLGYGCPITIEQIPAQVHDPKRPGDLLKNDNDHGCDSSRYEIISRPLLSVIPDQLKTPKNYNQRVSARTREMLLAAIKGAQRDGDYADALGMEVVDVGAECADSYSC